MSFKGFTKGVTRAPTLLKQKFNMGTKAEDDPVFVDAERRFMELETETKRLSEEADKYFKSVNGLLEHQIGFSKGVEEIYKPISGKASDPNATIQEDNPQGIEACEAYRALVTEVKTSLEPDLSLIEERIISPAKELLRVIQSIRKMLTKRNHKKIDLDKHTDSVKKLEGKKGERTPKDEERLYKYQSNVEVAQQEYDYYNDMCVKELPQLFALQEEFIKPLFVSFYFMQLNIFYTLHTRMEELKIPYFNLAGDLLESFAAKRGNVEELTDAIGICNFKTNHAKNKLELTKRRLGNKTGGTPPLGGTVADTEPLPLYTTGTSSFAPQTTGSTYSAPPLYQSVGTSPTGQFQQPAQTGQFQQPAQTGQFQQPAQTGQFQQPVQTGQFQQPVQTGQYQLPAQTGQQFQLPTQTPQQFQLPTQQKGQFGAAPASAVPAVAAAPTLEYCTALYDYNATAEGDLSFAAGSVIQIVERTPDENGWWTGVVNGQQGVFPGNYVQLNK